MNIPVTVVILAAGLGTRMKSRRAKVLHEAGGRALIEHTVDTALSLAEPDHVFVVVGHQADQVKRAVEGRGVRFIRQTEQKGTGHALIAGRESLAPLGGLLVVYYGDCPLIPAAVLASLIDHQKQSDAAGTLVSAELEDPTGYGRVIRDAGGRVLAVVEQKAGTPEQLAIREANVGIYCFQAGPFWQHIGELRPDNPAREYYLTDMIEILIRAGHKIDVFRADNPAALLGINNRVELAAADRTFRERKVRELMLAGITVEKPETVSVDATVVIGMDTVIEPFAQILGKTKIGEACRIGACSIVRHSELADNVQVAPFTMINTSRVAEGAHIGPYARLRLENDVAPGAHIGNFVELKKTRMGAGAKANHLAYLGDSVIGEGVNVGAGTITCNYDGRAKHQTKIGKGVFVGSNATLVAPVEIGDGAYLAAGSVITDSVPADALALGRARQVTKPDWARKRREKPTTKA
ncbi:MAG TPA: bifunctional UDP-N-acetylglucosamine diphosphorylase/glucosamine-1-phosphate N-acetyltransferase GlmU [Bryobacteraceae bacterium]|nr:bifunctional UDP-N-acetylglucosamine diphosphorylase/glucosamine-1-phosphate N-acetyltransferase GlmU [Bryobacteraceae bacterium]